MLWLCIALPQLPLEALCPQGIPHAASATSIARAQPSADLAKSPREQTVLITAREGSTRWVICCNEAAARANLEPGMNYNVALALHPTLIALERKPAAEQAALQRLAAWCYQFSSTVVVGEVPEELRRARTGRLWLEIGASLKLFGGLRPLITTLEQGLGSLGYTYSLGIGPTLEGAALLARAGIRVAITTPHALYERIRNLPLSLLALDPEIERDLHTVGVRTIGLLLELPREGVTKRFGPELGDFLDRLTGEAPDPRPLFQLPAEYRGRIDFECEVRSTEALLFPLRRLLYELAGFLRARDTGVEQFGIELAHRQGETSLRIGLSSSDRNAERFLTLVREKLERIDLPAPTLGIELYADRFAPPASLQPDMFDGSLQQSETLAHTLDRISARLGAEQVHGVKVVADHRPEASWAPAPPDEPRESLAFPDRPLWLLPDPKPLELSAMPQITSGPERIEAGWWDQGEVRRDYYIVRTSTGADLWVFRDLKTQAWYLHGFWS